MAKKTRCITINTPPECKGYTELYDADQVIYNGEGCDNLGIEKGDTLEEIVDKICENSGESPSSEVTVAPILGDLRFSWGEKTFKEGDTITEEWVKHDSFIPIYANNSQNQNHVATYDNVSIYNLGIEIPFWDEIKDLNPVLKIDRYKPKRNVRPIKNESLIIGRKYTQAGYKVAHPLSKDYGRVSSIPLTKAKDVYYIGQEFYFKYRRGLDEENNIIPFLSDDVNGYFVVKGLKYVTNSNYKKQKLIKEHYINTQEYLVDRFIGPFVHLGFRIEYQLNGKTISTGYLGHLKLLVEINLEFDTVKIRFKHQ